MDERNNDFTLIGLAIKKAKTAQGMTGEQLASIVDFIQFVTMFNISVDEYIFPNKEVNKNSACKRLDAQLDNLDDKELSIAETTVNSLCKAKKQRKEKPLFFFCPF